MNNKDEQIKIKNELALYYENLAYDMQNHGQSIIKELKSRVNDYTTMIFDLANTCEEFTYSDKQIKQLEVAQIRRSEVNSLLLGLDPDFLLKQAQLVREEIEKLVQGENFEAVY